LLSRHLPDYIEDGVGAIVKDFLATHQMTKNDIDLWAVHPGGRKIIEKVQLSLGLDDEQVADSWEILRQYGNMLSCSILFVMERMMLKLNTSTANSIAEGRRSHDPIDLPRPINGIAFSFSPGVGVEGILFEKV
jgi:alpha-pyrone synthase